jgi:hypothetical protein
LNVIRMLVAATGAMAALMPGKASRTFLEIERE